MPLYTRFAQSWPSCLSSMSNDLETSLRCLIVDRPNFTVSSITLGVSEPWRHCWNASHLSCCPKIAFCNFKRPLDLRNPLWSSKTGLVNLCCCKEGAGIASPLGSVEQVIGRYLQTSRVAYYVGWVRRSTRASRQEAGPWSVSLALVRLWWNESLQMLSWISRIRCFKGYLGVSWDRFTIVMLCCVWSNFALMHIFVVQI